MLVNRALWRVCLSCCRRFGLKIVDISKAYSSAWSRFGPARCTRVSLARMFNNAVAAEQDRFPLWIPVFFGLGIATYFAQMSEPEGLYAAGVACVLGATSVWARHNLAARAVILAPAFAAAGFAVADYREWQVAAPVLTKEIRGTQVSGTLLSRTLRADGATRIVLEVSAMTRVAPADRPHRIRINVRTRIGNAQPGDQVALRAGLMPPPGPAAPGAFDFGRQAYFRQLGAVGYALGPVEVTQRAADDWLTCAKFCVARLRGDLTQRIQTALPPPQGAVAAALMTGDRGGIPEDVLEDLRNAGLAHLLAISGLHMALFAGAMFWAIRGALVLVPGLALHAPIKKWAAAAALLGALGYLLISGASVATQRAFVMFALVFASILVDRPAITMRNVAIAALIVMVLTPEAVTEASFQMSFAAAIALVAFYEAARPWVSRWSTSAAERGTMARLALYPAGIALTSIVASVATSPFATYHFNRVVDFGLVANLVAIPLVGFVVMPAALVAFLAMPLGLEDYPLWLAGQGITVILWAAHEVAAWPGAVTIFPAMPVSSLAALILGGLWCALWRSPLRWVGALGPIVGIALAMSARQPDVLIDRDAKLVAVRTADGLFELSSARRASFSAQSWLRRDGDRREQREATGDSFTCDVDGCVAEVAGIGRLAMPANWRGVVEDCAATAVVVTQAYAPRNCIARHVIDRAALKNYGAHAFYLTEEIGQGKSVRVETACDLTGNRPWTRCSE